MNDYLKSTLIAVCLLFNSAHLNLQADDHEGEHADEARREALMERVADLREKAASMRRQGKQEAAEETFRKAKELYESVHAKNKERPEGRSFREHAESEEREAIQSRLKGLKERAEHLQREGKLEELKELQNHSRQLAARLSELRSLQEGEREERVIERRRVVRREDHDGDREEQEMRPEDHVRRAIEHIHAAGWHDVAEQLERELHERMEQRRHHDNEPIHAHLREIMEGVEHRFQAVREHIEHMERALD